MRISDWSSDVCSSDLPTLSLVIHVEIPRDAEALQHRSGRTGRAGKKGTAVIIVPYPRRSRVDGMLRGARINAEWMDALTAADVRARDKERLRTEERRVRKEHVSKWRSRWTPNNRKQKT